MGLAERRIFLFYWCAREESNLDFSLRRAVFDPLNYGRFITRILLETEPFFNGIDKRRLIVDFFEDEFKLRPYFFRCVRRRHNRQGHSQLRSKIEY